MSMSHRIYVVLLSVVVFLMSSKSAWAAPYFYIDGPASITVGQPENYYLRINPDGNELNTLQAVFNIPNGYFSNARIDITDTRSPTPTPIYLTPPPTPTPQLVHRCDIYIKPSTVPDSNGNVIVSCGFTTPNTPAEGAFVARIVLSAANTGNISLNFDNAQSQFIGGRGNSVTAGVSINKPITIAGVGVTLTPTPTPTPTGTIIPTPTNTPTASPTPIAGPTTVTPTTGASGGDSYGLNASDVNFVTIAPFPTPTTGDNAPLEVVEENNTVPTPPPITPRPPATPFPTPNPDGSTQDSGEVLAVQSIRDLLIPGKSSADKNVVLFNFISLITLFSIIIVIIWRIIMLKRRNKLKQRHIADLINGELATLETKLTVLEEKDGAKSFQDEFEKTLDNIQQELNVDEKKKTE